jgi:hypothetical protein
VKLVSFGDLAAGAELIDHLGLALATYDGRTCGRLTMALEHLPPPVGPVANVATSNGAVFLWICATSPDPARTAAVTEVLTHFNWSTPTAVEEHVLEDSVPYGYNDGPLRMALLYRRTDLTRHEFGRHLLTRHAPLVLASGPMFKRYTVNIEPPQDCA